MVFNTIEEKRAYQRAWCKANPEHDREKKQRKKERARKFVDEYKLTIACVICGEDHPACIDFHHTDPASKDKSISVMIGRGTSLKTIKRELEKCVPLCGNCHQKLHAKERNGDSEI